MAFRNCLGRDYDYSDDRRRRVSMELSKNGYAVRHVKTSRESMNFSVLLRVQALIRLTGRRKSILPTSTPL
jgi:hypothetical protein